ncbi:hypothetical protein [Marinobacter sp. SS5-14b]|uniref:hypothetical protein n=1 Tax=Marinobacter sp. SS5-14b TaxID=3050456 RepID=UPI0026DF87CB|nr:hypothetical protein [Marinobacter sp. SS5-14b]
MSAFTIISTMDKHHRANNEAITEDPNIGETTIQYLEDGRAFFVCPQATRDDIDGFYITCCNDEEAQELARQGVIVFDGDKIYESLTQREKDVFNACIEDECYIDNPVVTKIASALLLQKSSGKSVMSLPIRYYCSAAQVLLPNEFEFLKTANKPSTIITIHTNKTQINHP